MITVQCPHCQAMFRMDAKHAGRSMTCKRCESEFPVAAYHPPAEAAPSRRAAAAPHASPSRVAASPPPPPPPPPLAPHFAAPPPLPVAADPRLTPFSSDVIAAVRQRVRQEKARARRSIITLPRITLWSLPVIVIIVVLILRTQREREEERALERERAAYQAMPPRLREPPPYEPPMASDVNEAVPVTLEEVGRGKATRLLVAVSDFELSNKYMVTEPNPHRPGQWQRVWIPLHVPGSLVPTRRIERGEMYRVAAAILVSSSIRTQADLDALMNSPVIIGSVTGTASSLEADTLNLLSRFNFMPMDKLRGVPVINHDDLSMPGKSSNPAILRDRAAKTPP